MSFAANLRKGRSHLIIAAILLIGGHYVVRIENETLAREAEKPIPEHDLAPPATEPQASLPTAAQRNPALPQLASAP